MRYLVPSLIGLLGSTAGAQDATQQAIQIQQQQALQQLSQQQQDLVNQQQLNQISNAGLAGYQVAVRTPHLQQQPGGNPAEIMVEMQDSSRGTSIFYTTDGWTPTGASQRYIGPITIRETSTVRAIAIAPGGRRSYVAVLPVHVGTSVSPPNPATTLKLDKLLPGTKLSLAFTAPVTSRGKRVGDSLPIALAEDVLVNGSLVAARGTPIHVVVTQVDNSHVQGLPGSLSFSVRSMDLPGGKSVALLGVETMEGADRTQRANLLSIVPLGGLAAHGGDALIASGFRLEAEIADPVHSGCL